MKCLNPASAAAGLCMAVAALHASTVLAEADYRIYPATVTLQVQSQVPKLNKGEDLGATQVLSATYSGANMTKVARGFLPTGAPPDLAGNKIGIAFEETETDCVAQLVVYKETSTPSGKVFNLKNVFGALDLCDNDELVSRPDDGKAGDINGNFLHRVILRTPVVDIPDVTNIMALNGELKSSSTYKNKINAASVETSDTFNVNTTIGDLEADGLKGVNQDTIDDYLLVQKFTVAVTGLGKSPVTTLEIADPIVFDDEGSGGDEEVEPATAADLYGTWFFTSDEDAANSAAASSLDYVAFFSDGKYAFGGQDNDPNCDQDYIADTTPQGVSPIDPDGNGAEYANWSIASDGSLTTSNALVDSNGSCGFFNKDEANTLSFFKVDSATLLIKEGDDEIGFLKRLPNNDANLVGAWTIASAPVAGGTARSVWIFFSDGTDFFIGTNEDGGIVRGTHSLNGNMLTSTTDGAEPLCIDTNGIGDSCDNDPPVPETFGFAFTPSSGTPKTSFTTDEDGDIETFTRYNP